MLLPSSLSKGEGCECCRLHRQVAGQVFRKWKEERTQSGLLRTVHRKDEDLKHHSRCT